MNLGNAILAITALAAVGLLAGLGVLFFGSSNQIDRVPPSGLLVAAAITFGGMIYLQASRGRAPASQRLRMILSTIGFAMLVVIAMFLIGFFLTGY